MPKEKITTIFQFVEAYSNFKQDLDQDGHTANVEFFVEVNKEDIEMSQVVESINQFVAEQETYLRYKYIRAWGVMLGSYEYYIRGEIDKAIADNAPLDAIYKKDNVWHTFADVKKEGVKETIKDIISRMK